MKIAVWHNLPSGGGKRALWDHVRLLVEFGHQVESWCPPTADQRFLPLSDLVPEHIVDLRRPHGGRRAALRDVAVDSLAASEGMDEHARACLARIEDLSFDVIFGNACMFYRTNPLGRLSTIPSALYLQEPYRWLYEALPEPPWAADVRTPAWWRRPAQLRSALEQGLESRRRRLQIRSEVENAKGYDLLLCNSAYSRESILRAYGIDPQICYLSVDTDRLRPPTDTREDFYLTVGACVKEKDVAWIVRALAQVPDRWPLVWVCNYVDDHYMNEVTTLARELGVELILRMGVPQQEVDDLLRRAGLFLYAPRLEPFGLAPLEAAACALPAVVRAEAGTRETVLHDVTGLLIGPSHSEFADAVSSLMANVHRRAELGASARDWAERCWNSKEGGARLERALSSVTRTETTTSPLGTTAAS